MAAACCSHPLDLLKVNSKTSKQTQLNLLALEQSSGQSRYADVQWTNVIRDSIGEITNSTQ